MGRKTASHKSKIVTASDDKHGFRSKNQDGTETAKQESGQKPSEQTITNALSARPGKKPV